ncbi:hypothetical protein Tco_1378351 [Tanacetum coccineum]
MDGDVDLELGFMVFNWAGSFNLFFVHITHPNMMELFQILGIDIELYDISFSVNLDKKIENIEEKVDEVLKPYELASDEWYYEIELEIFNNWKAEEEEEVNNQRSLQLSRDHEEQLAFMSHYNLFEDNSCEDEAYYTNEDDFES